MVVVVVDLLCGEYGFKPHPRQLLCRDRDSQLPSAMDACEQICSCTLLGFEMGKANIHHMQLYPIYACNLRA